MQNNSTLIFGISKLKYSKYNISNSGWQILKSLKLEKC